ncbi:SDR family oxidoreductase [Novosphingobium sp. M1R2S20]|uniref:SDR family oxidoreductase n=1 Tax=Novosphingobium rhizovicinum TaxID=3228928 RepID=A0ABV3RAS7_9SPHN
MRHTAPTGRGSASPRWLPSRRRDPPFKRRGGLLGMTKSLAMEFAARNMMPPGFINTPMLLASPVDVDAYAATMPMRRPGMPEDIAAACSYLASPDAAYVTGQTINTNGGRYMGSA